MEALGPVLILISLPLILRWIPRNRFYGFRISTTLESDAVWYATNARSGRDMLLLGLLMVALEFVLPRPALVWVLGPLAVVGLMVNAVVSWRLARRLAREGAARLRR